MSLDRLIAKVPEETGGQARVDLGAYTGSEPGEDVLTLREPSVAELFKVPEWSEEIQAREPEWPQSLCQSVALLAVSHVEPVSADTPAAEFYMALARRSRTVFLHVLSEYQAAFPHLTDLKAAVADAKNASGAGAR